jgi:DNA-directed RNA polymerase subunit M/transcription elongation factor TFIIS
MEICFTNGLFIIILLTVRIGLVVWSIRDSRNRGDGNSLLWGVLIFVFGVIGCLIYILSRPTGQLIICNNCGGRKLMHVVKCPHCQYEPNINHHKTHNYEISNMNIFKHRKITNSKTNTRRNITTKKRFCIKCGTEAPGSFCSNCSNLLVRKKLHIKRRKAEPKKKKRKAASHTANTYVYKKKKIHRRKK